MLFFNILVCHWITNSLALKHWRAALANTGAAQCVLCKLCYGLSLASDSRS